MIKKENGKFVLYSKDGDKKLGTFDTKEAAEKREKEIQFFKHSKKAMVDVSLTITKASLQADGTMRWQAVTSDTSVDRTGERTSLGLFQDWIERTENGQSAAFLPPPRVPFLGVSHYPDLEGLGEAGPTEKMYIDGNRFKAAGTFYGDDTRPLGKALFEAVRREQDLVKRGEFKGAPIRISAAWWDLAHSHGDFVFERKSLSEACPMCVAGGGDKVYLRGQLDHFAATRVPINPNTSLALEEKSMATRKQDAESIVGEELAEELEAKAKPIGKSETELPDGLVVKADEEKAVHDKKKAKKEMADEVDDEEMGEEEEEEETRPVKKKKGSHWDQLEADLRDIAALDDLTEVKAQLTATLDQFDQTIDTLKSALPDAFLISSIGDNIVSEETTTTTVAPLDEAIEALYDALNGDIDRKGKLEKAQIALEAVANAVKADIDVATPPDASEAITKAFSPVVEKLDLLLAKLDGQAQPQVVVPQPQQKSLAPGQSQPQTNGGLPISPMTGKPSALRAMIERSVGMHQ